MSSVMVNEETRDTLRELIAFRCKDNDAATEVVIAAWPEIFAATADEPDPDRRAYLSVKCAMAAKLGRDWRQYTKFAP